MSFAGSSRLGSGVSALAIAAVVAFASPALAAPRPSESATAEASTPKPATTKPTRLYADSQSIEVQTETVWRPMCGSSASQLDTAQLDQIAETLRTAEPNVAAVADPEPTVDFELTFNKSGTVPAEAAQALAEVERYIESRFTNAVEVVVDVSFTPLPLNILGATANNFVLLDWPVVRDGLVAGMDGDDTIQDWLPAGATIPVRYNIFTDEVTDENRVHVTFANHRAAIGSLKGNDGTMIFNSELVWDYTPPSIGTVDGPEALSFQDVVVHEVAHILGFSSGVDGPNNTGRPFDIELLDIYRFQMTDGEGTNYNPDTLEEFTTTPRLADRGPSFPMNDDNVVSDLISDEYRMSDGAPSQASHFRAMFPKELLMDPFFVPGETFYPDYFQAADINMLDAIGWDYPHMNTTCSDSLDVACNDPRHFDNSLVFSTPEPAFSCGVGAEHDGTLWFKFVPDTQSVRISTCDSVGENSTFAIYEGECGSLVEIACSEDSGCGTDGTLSSVCLSDLVRGHTYYVQIAAATPADTGLYTISVECMCDLACSTPNCCTQADSPVNAPNPVDKTRFLSLVPSNDGIPIALRVTLTSLHHPMPRNFDTVFTSDFSEFEGEVRWAGPLRVDEDSEILGTEILHAELQCDPVFTEWPPGEVVHLHGAEIVPSSVYQVEAVRIGCADTLDDPSLFSAPLQISTARWGDIIAPFQDVLAPYPAIQPDVRDLTAMVDTVKNIPSAMSKPNALLHPNAPDPSRKVNVIDLTLLTDTVKGLPYPYPGPTSCPTP